MKDLRKPKPDNPPKMEFIIPTSDMSFWGRNKIKIIIFFVLILFLFLMFPYYFGWIFGYVISQIIKGYNSHFLSLFV